MFGGFGHFLANEGANLSLARLTRALICFIELNSVLMLVT